MKYLRNEVVLLPMPFSDLTNRKVRPAVVIGNKARDLFLMPIISELSNTISQFDWRGAGLNVLCEVKGQIAKVESRLVLERVGTLAAVDILVLDQRLRAWLRL